MKKVFYATLFLTTLATGLVANEEGKDLREQMEKIAITSKKGTPEIIEKDVLSQKEDSKQELTAEYEKLLEEATQARENAYAPYSKFKVGAAVLTEDGKVFTGCNIENASYGLVICAERCAIFNAVSEGYTKFKALAVILDDNEPGRPCGACRQVIREFGKDIVVIMSNLNGDIDIETISGLLPKAFALD